MKRKKSMIFGGNIRKITSFIGAFVFIFSVAGCIFGSGYDDYVDRKIKPLEIEGKIVGKYNEETGCFGAIIIEQNKGLDTLRNIFYCTQAEHKVWRYIQPGDSVYKHQGTLEVYIIRNGMRKKFTFPTRI